MARVFSIRVLCGLAKQLLMMFHIVRGFVHFIRNKIKGKSVTDISSFIVSSVSNP